jgi:hypothetical protein
VRIARDKHSSLLRKFLKYGRKKVYNVGPWKGRKKEGKIKEKGRKKEGKRKEK